MRVQTSGATIKGNTILNPNGGISLEDGGFNTVSDNIIIRTTDIASSSDRPAGVLVTPLGHTVSNNYIAGIRSGNKEAGGMTKAQQKRARKKAGASAALDSGTNSSPPSEEKVAPPAPAEQPIETGSVKSAEEVRLLMKAKMEAAKKAKGKKDSSSAASMAAAEAARRDKSKKKRDKSHFNQIPN